MTWIERIHQRYVIGRRARVLSERVAELLPADADVLDIGCGDGRIAWLVAQRRADVRIRGVDVLVREGVAIAVEPFDGQRLPFEDRSFDVVMFVDVLHHTDDPERLLVEAARVARRSVVIKDHLRDGLLAAATLRFMDRVGNRRHGVALPHNYWTRDQWRQSFESCRMTVESWSERLRLYPWPASLVFDRSLHFLASTAPLQHQD